MLDYKNLNMLNLTGEYLVVLLSCVLNELEIPPLPDELNWEDIYNMARAHSVEAMAFDGAKEFLVGDIELYQRWKKRKDQNIVQSIVQFEEQNRIFDKFYKEGILFLPLKGFELKKLYRQTYFRQISDLDILVQSKDSEKVKRSMELLGYSTYEYGKKYHDGYFLYPYVNVEIHRNMIPEDTIGYEYCNNIWRKAIPDSTIPGGLKLLPEDFYLFYLIHFAKHYNNLGSGIRSLMDIYVYLQAFEKKMDRNYIDKELNKLGLYEFGSLMEELSNQWFSPYVGGKKRISDKALIKIQRNIFLAGIYGSREFAKARIMNEDKEKGKLRGCIKYIWGRVFMSKKEFEYAYPLTKKYTILIPIFWIYRMFDVFFHKRKSIRKEIELLLENEREE